MKLLHKILMMMPLLCWLSCTKDKGNYDYAEKEVISVEGLDPYYSKITSKDRLVLDPIVSSNKDADFEYFWGIIRLNEAGTLSFVDTISKAKKLDFPITERAKEWTLIFNAKNKKTGYANLIKFTLNVATEFTMGWYVVKDEAGQTDLDLFLTPQSIIPASRRENVYSLVNGRKLDGKAGMLNFSENYKSAINGTFVNTRTLFLVSEKDVSAVDISDLREIRGYNSIFAGPPADKSPVAVINEPAWSLFMLNAGQLHSIGHTSTNMGQFSGASLRDVKNTPYYLSKYYLINLFAPYFFDEMSSSFVLANSGSLYLTSILDDKATQLKANNNNQKMLYMGMKTQSPLLGYAIFQDKTNPALKMLTSVAPGTTTFKMINEILNPTDKIYNGSNFGVIYQDESLIYFSLGREIWSRNLANKFEQLQYTLPVGEEVTFIKHRKYTATGLMLPYSYNYVMVGSKSGGNYKVRMFNKSSGNLNAEPAFVLEGKGAPGDVIFIAPTVTSQTYPSTF